MDLGCPKSISKNNTGIGIEFVWSHFKPMAFFLLFFCAIWNGFLIFWYFGLNTTDMPLIAKLFPIGHIAVGIGLTYYTVSLFIDKTSISINNGILRVKDFPLPLGNTKNINIIDIKQIYVSEKISSDENSSSSSFVLMAITNDGKLIKIVKGLNEKEEALFLEQELEKILNIQPESVKGEVK